MYLQLICFLCVWELAFPRPFNDEQLLEDHLEERFPDVNMTERRIRYTKLSGSDIDSKPLGGKPKPAMENNNMVAVNPYFPDIVSTNQDSRIAYYMYQTDMHLDEEQLKEREAANDATSSLRSKRQALQGAKKWTNGIVYYSFDSGLDPNTINIVNITIQYYEKNTCIRFKYSKTAFNRVKIINDTGCYSMIGMVGNVQLLSLGTGCNTEAICYHELYHTLGGIHAHSRSDRDDFLTVNETDVPNCDDYLQTGLRNNFKKENMTTLVPLEYGSAMMYRVNAFTPNGTWSLTPVKSDYWLTMGSDIVSFYDTIMINKYYCASKISTSQCKNMKCKNGGDCNPNDNTKCIGPRGYSGDKCDQRPAGCGSVLNATSSWQNVTVNMGTNGTIKTVFDYCYYWITAPNGTQPQVRIIFISDACYYGCTAKGVEIKTENSTMTNKRHCCKYFDATYEIYIGQLNPMPVILYNRMDVLIVTFEYMAVLISG